MKGCRWMTYHLTVHEVCVSKKTNRLTTMYLTRYIVVGEREWERLRGGGAGPGERTRRYTISLANELWLLVIRKDTDVYFRGQYKQTNKQQQQKPEEEQHTEDWQPAAASTLTVTAANL